MGIKRLFADTAQVDLILPQESAAAVRQHLQSATPPRYSRVRMTLGQILERQFFTLYVKEGWSPAAFSVA